jgi:hypothetical protein
VGEYHHRRVGITGTTASRRDGRCHDGVHAWVLCCDQGGGDAYDHDKMPEEDTRALRLHRKGLTCCLVEQAEEGQWEKLYMREVGGNDRG